MKELAVIIPAYNAEKTITNTIESILSQSYEDYEIIIVNDHSEDDTEKICRMYEKNNSKIKFFNNSTEKKGVSSARNLGLEQSNSKYIMFMDSDDLYEKDMLLQMITNIEENDFVICGIKRNYNDINQNSINIPDEITTTNVEQIKDTIEYLQGKDLFNGPCNKIFKSEIITKNNIKFQENISLGEDYRFVLDYTEQCKKIKTISKALYIYNRTKSGLALKYDNNNLRVRLDNLNHHKKFYLRNNLNTDYIDKKIVLTILSGFAEIVRNNSKNEAKRIIKQYITEKGFKKELESIEDKKLKIFIIILSTDKILINYYLGKIYNFIKKYLKR